MGPEGGFLCFAQVRCPVFISCLNLTDLTARMNVSVLIVYAADERANSLVLSGKKDDSSKENVRF